MLSDKCVHFGWFSYLGPLPPYSAVSARSPSAAWLFVWLGVLQPLSAPCGTAASLVEVAVFGTPTAKQDNSYLLSTVKIIIQCTYSTKRDVLIKSCFSPLLIQQTCIALTSRTCICHKLSQSNLTESASFAMSLKYFTMKWTKISYCISFSVHDGFKLFKVT